MDLGTTSSSQHRSRSSSPAYVPTDNTYYTIEELFASHAIG
jgi:hypothetical protein